jgi:hypothetical protein
MGRFSSLAKASCDIRFHNPTKNKRLRSFLSNFHQTSKRFAMKEPFGHSSETSFPVLRNSSRIGAFTGGPLVAKDA